MTDFDSDLRQELRRYRETKDLAHLWAAILHVRHDITKLFQLRLDDPSKADDLFQDFVIKVFHARDVIDPDVNPFGWMITVARNMKFSYFRERQREGVRQAPPRELETLEYEHDVLEGLLRRFHSKEIQGRLKGLKESDRQIVELFFMEDETESTTAQLLERSQKSVKKRLEKLRPILRRLLRDLASDETQAPTSKLEADEDHT